MSVAGRRFSPSRRPFDLVLRHLATREKAGGFQGALDRWSAGLTKKVISSRSEALR
jgi:hypothetical protein